MNLKIENRKSKSANLGSALVSPSDWPVLLVVFCILTGCAQQMKVRFNAQPGPEEVAQEVSRIHQSVAPHSGAGPISAGSLWPADDRTFFYGDRKAFRVGDVLTIRVSES